MFQPRDKPNSPRTEAALTCMAAMGVLLSTMGQPTSAATEVRQQANVIHLRAENASIREVLAALSGTFKLTYKLPPAASQVFTGLYSGSLQQVLSRILDGNDYIVNVLDDGIEVIVLRASGATTLVPANHAIPARENPGTTDRTANEPSTPPTPPLSRYLSLDPSAATSPSP